MEYTTTDARLVELAHARATALWDALDLGQEGAIEAGEKVAEMDYIYEGCLRDGKFSYVEALVAIHLTHQFLSGLNVQTWKDEDEEEQEDERTNPRDYPEEAGLYDVMMYER